MSTEKQHDELPDAEKQRFIKWAASYERAKRFHLPHNVNALHKAEQAAAGFNQKLAILLTRSVGTMICAYIFAALAIIGFPGLVNAQISQWVQWTSQTFIQLTMLSVIMVGQAVLGRKQELQSDETYHTSKQSYEDIEEIMKHLDAQDAQILAIVERLESKP